MAVGIAEGIDLTLAGRRVRLQLCQLGLACCGIEVRAALRSPDLLQTVRAIRAEATQLDDSAIGEPVAASSRQAQRDEPSPGPTDLNVLIVAGTITAATAGIVRAAYDQLAEPRAVLAFGACAISGGPYWDSYAVVAGADRLIPVDVVLAGCPPRPTELRGALELLVSHA